ncbi:MAG: Tim44-like domain protein [Firmicutes bacterium ADurb.Bin182]|nr:MAG: Tim44-like domain protein [Firmicutes bacterium ADurb.Bin182]
MPCAKRLIVALLILALLAAAGSALADAGGFAGDSDFGGSDFDFGGSSGWSDSGWDSGYSGGGFYIGGGGGGSPSFVTVIVIIAVVIYIISRYAKNKNFGRAPGAVPVSAPVGMPVDLSKLYEKDPDFSPEAFLQMVSNMYVKLQNSWESKDWEPMRMLMTDALYSQFANQLEELKQNGQTNHVDRIAVLGTRITGYSQTESNDVLKVEVKSRIVDFVTDDTTGKIVRGSDTRELFMTYEYTLIRSLGVKTEVKEGENRSVCKACGAPILLNQSNRCEFCGTLMRSDEFNWVISAIRGISQRSA